MTFRYFVAFLFLQVVSSVASVNGLGNVRARWSYNNSASCGVAKVPLSLSDDRIVGGINAEKGQYPWMVSLVFANLIHTCGATIIDEQWILTAAHCFQTLNATFYKARIGAYDLRKYELSSKNYSVDYIVLHPEWSISNFLNDIALVRLKQPIDFANLYVNRVCLPETDPFDTDNELARIVGWGDLKNVTGVNQAAILQQANITIQTNLVCSSYWGVNYDHYSKLCAKSPTTAICVGDSGGPIMVTDGNGTYIQVGISSFVRSSGCLHPYPNVFTRVSYHMPWISSVLDGSYFNGSPTIRKGFYELPLFLMLLLCAWVLQ